MPGLFRVTLPSSAEPSLRERLLRLQKATYAHLQEQLKSQERHETRQLRLYRSRYEREVAGYRKISSKAELVERVAEVPMVYCGDYHTLWHAQRTALKLLTSVSEKKRNILLGLELIPKSGEKLANDYVRGRVSEETFLEGIAYSKRWGFPWRHYRPLFQLAKERKFRILGLNADESDRVPLEARDDLAADFIVEAVLTFPEALIFCLYGDLHWAESHIPHRVKIRLKSQGAVRRAITIFQNSEEIYWKLADAGLAESTDVVEVAKDKFCVLSAAPWVKWQSYQSWLEDQTELLDQPEEGDGGHPIRDYYHQVLDLALQISHFLKVQPKGLEHFSVYTASDVKMIEELEKHCEACNREDVPIEEIVRAEILENRSSYFPESSILYLNDLSANRAAEKAAQLVVSKLTPHSTLFGSTSNIREIFYRVLLWEAIGFFGSKIINPKRKCDQYGDYELFIRRTRRRRLKGRLRDWREAAIGLLAHRGYEVARLRTEKARGLPRKLFRLSPEPFFMAASAIGKILAEQLYLRMTRDEMSLSEIQQFMSLPSNDSYSARQRYWALAKFLPVHRLDQVSKEDRF